MFRFLALLVAVVALASSGCESGNSSGEGKSEMERMAEMVEQEDAAKVKEEVEAASQAEANPAPEPEPEEPSVVTSNDMKKGSSLRGQGGYLSAVGAARFSAEHKMILNSITRALQLYNAEHGHYPKSHEEFMKKIIEFNEITLPELMPGYEYFYDPADHQLKKRSTGGGDPEPLD